MADTRARKSRPGKRDVAARRRLTREDWLAFGLRVMEEDGTGALTVDRLTSEAGVTRGSFYWHFANHTDFLVELTEKWVNDYTQIVVETAGADSGLSPREQLRKAIVLVLGKGLARLDIHFRELATDKPEVMEVVRRGDALRTAFVSRLLAAQGFSGDDLDTRVHALVVLLSVEAAVHTGFTVTSKNLEQVAEQRLAFFLN
jgi:AcrR family transcriptional regulator